MQHLFHPPFRISLTELWRVAIIDGMVVNRHGQMTSRLRECREAKGLTVSHLAFIAQVTPQAVRSLEKGKHYPTLIVARNLAKALRVSISTLFPEVKE